MGIQMKMRKQLKEILGINISEDIFVKVYDTSYSVNVKIYQKYTEFGTELFVNVDLDPLNVLGLAETYEEAVEIYIRENVRVLYEYDAGEERYTVSLRNYKAK